MKPVISQRAAFCIGYVHGIFWASIPCVLLLVIAHFVTPTKVSWLIPATLACVGIAARLGYSILVDRVLEGNQKREG